MHAHIRDVGMAQNDQNKQDANTHKHLGQRLTKKKVSSVGYWKRRPISLVFTSIEG